MKKRFLFFIVLLSWSFQSCVYSVSIGDSSDKSISSFSGIKVSDGLRVILVPGNEESIKLKNQENWRDHIKANVKNEILVIAPKKRYFWTKKKTVIITYKDLNYLRASSGSSISSEAVLKSRNLNLRASSGSTFKLEILAESTTVQASSGSSISLFGKTLSIQSRASSGSSLKLENLKSKTSRARASSGSSIHIYAEESLKARATSGSSIRYYGNPKEVHSNKNVSASISADD